MPAQKESQLAKMELQRDRSKTRQRSHYLDDSHGGRNENFGPQQMMALNY